MRGANEEVGTELSAADFETEYDLEVTASLPKRSKTTTSVPFTYRLEESSAPGHPQRLIVTFSRSPKEIGVPGLTSNKSWALVFALKPVVSILPTPTGPAQSLTSPALVEIVNPGSPVTAVWSDAVYKKGGAYSYPVKNEGDGRCVLTLANGQQIESISVRLLDECGSFVKLYKSRKESGKFSLTADGAGAAGPFTLRDADSLPAICASVEGRSVSELAGAGSSKIMFSNPFAMALDESFWQTSPTMALIDQPYIERTLQLHLANVWPGWRTQNPLILRVARRRNHFCATILTEAFPFSLQPRELGKPQLFIVERQTKDEEEWCFPMRLGNDFNLDLPTAGVLKIDIKEATTRAAQLVDVIGHAGKQVLVIRSNSFATDASVSICRVVGGEQVSPAICQVQVRYRTGDIVKWMVDADGSSSAAIAGEVFSVAVSGRDVNGCLAKVGGSHIPVLTTDPPIQDIVRVIGREERLYKNAELLSLANRHVFNLEALKVGAVKLYFSSPNVTGSEYRVEVMKVGAAHSAVGEPLRDIFWHTEVKELQVKVYDSKNNVIDYPQNTEATASSLCWMRPVASTRSNPEPVLSKNIFLNSDGVNRGVFDRMKCAFVFNKWRVKREDAHEVTELVLQDFKLSLSEKSGQPFSVANVKIPVSIPHVSHHGEQVVFPSIQELPVSFVCDSIGNSIVSDLVAGTSAQLRIPLKLVRGGDATFTAAAFEDMQVFWEQNSQKEVVMGCEVRFETIRSSASAVTQIVVPLPGDKIKRGAAKISMEFRQTTPRSFSRTLQDWNLNVLAGKPHSMKAAWVAKPANGVFSVWNTNEAVLASIEFILLDAAGSNAVVLNGGYEIKLALQPSNDAECTCELVGADQEGFRVFSLPPVTDVSGSVKILTQRQQLIVGDSARVIGPSRQASMELIITLMDASDPSSRKPVTSVKLKMELFDKKRHDSEMKEPIQLVKAAKDYVMLSKDKEFAQQLLATNEGCAKSLWERHVDFRNLGFFPGVESAPDRSQLVKGKTRLEPVFESLVPGAAAVKARVETALRRLVTNPVEIRTPEEVFSADNEQDARVWGYMHPGFHLMATKVLDKNIHKALHQVLPFGNFHSGGVRNIDTCDNLTADSSTKLKDAVGKYHNLAVVAKEFAAEGRKIRYMHELVNFRLPVQHAFRNFYFNRKAIVCASEDEAWRFTERVRELDSRVAGLKTPIPDIYTMDGFKVASWRPVNPSKAIGAADFAGDGYSFPVVYRGKKETAQTEELCVALKAADASYKEYSDKQIALESLKVQLDTQLQNVEFQQLIELSIEELEERISKLEAEKDEEIEIESRKRPATDRGAYNPAPPKRGKALTSQKGTRAPLGELSRGNC